MARVVKDHVLVGLVRDDPDAVRIGNGRDSLDVSPGEDAARGVVRRVDVDGLGLRRNLRLELVEIVAPAEPLVERAGDDNAMGEPDVTHRRRPLRVRHDDLVTGLEQRVAQDIECVDPAVRHQDFLGVPIGMPFLFLSFSVSSSSSRGTPVVCT